MREGGGRHSHHPFHISHVLISAHHTTITIHSHVLISAHVCSFGEAPIEDGTYPLDLHAITRHTVVPRLTLIRRRIPSRRKEEVRGRLDQVAV